MINDPQALKAGYDLVFDENFDTLSVSAWGPGTRWIAHTPWSGDFGQASFADPVTGFPFSIQNGILRIEARKVGTTWQSGLLASVDPNGNGFSQQYGYFEIRAQLPQGEGVWPAFWLDSMIPSSSSDPSLEVDGFEYYGKYTDAFNTTVTLWPKDRTLATSTFKTVPVAPLSLASAYHIYGVSVEADWTIVYLDGAEVWRTATPPAHAHKLMILVDLALGGADQSIAALPSPVYMYIDYIRAYRRTGTTG